MTKEEKTKITDKIKISIEETLIQINEYRELTRPIHPDNRNWKSFKNGCYKQ